MKPEEKIDLSIRNKNKEYYNIISSNIKKLLIFHNKSQETLCYDLEKYGVYITQNSLSKYLPKRANQVSIPISLIIACCDIFQVSIGQLSSVDFDPYQEQFINSIQKNIQKTMDDAELDFANYLAAGIARSSDKYIVNGNDEAFNGYYQSYYGYLFPTISSEKEPLTAEIEFKKEDNICKVTVKLNTGKKTEHGIAVYKYYHGLMVIVEKTKSCYCILTRKKVSTTNELCFLNFRYIPISDVNRKLDCRMVEVLTTSAGGDSSFPTAHRMFMSRSDIAKDHLDYVLPHLHLNHSTITIEEKKLFQVAALSPQYQKIIKKIISLIPNSDTEKCGLLQQLENPKNFFDPQVETDPEASMRQTMYVLKEDLIKTTAMLYLTGAQVQIFIAELRKYSYTVRYNKVSKKLDDNVRKMLIGLGYYFYGKDKSQ